MVTGMWLALGRPKSKIRTRLLSSLLVFINQMSEPHQNQNAPNPPRNQEDDRQQLQWQVPLTPDRVAKILNNQWGPPSGSDSTAIPPASTAKDAPEPTAPASTTPPAASPSISSSPPRQNQQLTQPHTISPSLEADLTTQLDKLSLAQTPPAPPTTPSHSIQTAIIFQPPCVLHRFVRNKTDIPTIVERPERVRAVKTGVALALAHSELFPDISSRFTFPSPTHTPSLLTDPSVHLVHGASYPSEFASWCAHSAELLSGGAECELPNTLPTGDLYVCPESVRAVEGCLGAVYTAVDTVFEGTARNAFCVVRPPGHHCGSNDPMGFCFVNNVACGAVYAARRWGVEKVVVLDIDLHHGNGTQDIAWTLNELEHLPPDPSDPSSTNTPLPASLRFFYGSTHDILSYPCESGQASYVQSASLRLMAHSQAVWNVHLEPWTTLASFSALYETHYSQIITKAREWLRATASDPAKTLVFISCGFDASEYEHEGMRRHGVSVPADFYHRFARDAAEMARECAMGRIVSVLEGGYSDRTLVAGAAAHVVGLAEGAGSEESEGGAFPNDVKLWWSIPELEAVERRVLQGKRGKHARKSGGGAREKVTERVAELLEGWEREDKELMTAMAPVVLPQPVVASRHSTREKKRVSDVGVGAGGQGKV